MRVLILSLGCLVVACGPSARELEAHLAVTDSHLDRLSESLDALNAKITSGAPAQRAVPAVVGVTCRDGKLTEYAEGGLRSGERALGKVGKCSAPKDYAQCLAGQPLSDVAAACEAGKLDALLDDKKTEKKP